MVYLVCRMIRYERSHTRCIHCNKSIILDNGLWKHTRGYFGCGKSFATRIAEPRNAEW
jgi:hypothetical protein